jgi:hypothetical protein
MPEGHTLVLAARRLAARLAETFPKASLVRVSGQVLQ